MGKSNSAKRSRGKTLFMSALHWSGLLVVGVGALGFVQHQGHGGQGHAGQPHAGPQHAARGDDVFASRCITCHVVPDPKFEADRAYISQIYETA